jgi:hypothetical protein
MLVEIGDKISREEAVKVANRILQDSEEGRKTIAELEAKQGLSYESEEGCKCQKKSN